MTKGQTPWLVFSQRFFFYHSPGTNLTSTAQITKCTFHKFGASGSVQKFDGICVLPLNIINEKIYVFLWFWFVLLAVSLFYLAEDLKYPTNFHVQVITKLQMIYRLSVLALPCLRATLLKVF